MEDQPIGSNGSDIFLKLYKYKGRNAELSQKQRREKFLEELKQKRHQIFDDHRQLCETLLKDINIHEQMDCETSKILPEKSLKFRLLQSEWFTEVPDDLEENWLVKFCPQGFRILLVARNHGTIFYNIKGRIILKIKSNFPGGGACESNGITALDCIFNKYTKTIFIIDCLFWNSMSMLESEVNFRFIWLKSKFAENPQFRKCFKYNFALLDYIPALRTLVQERLFNTLTVEDKKVPYDGVVFYHKESHYTYGYTPLVAWLSSYMITEKLKIEVSPEHLVNRPKDYVNMEKYLETISKKKKKKIEGECIEEEIDMDI